MVDSILRAKGDLPCGGMKSLGDHTRDVCNAADELFGTSEHPTHLGTCWLRFFRMEREDWPQFFWNLTASTLLHDWGKANEDMQKILRRQGRSQCYRHEHLSVLAMTFPGVRNWLEQRSDIDWRIVRAAVGSHHLKLADRGFAMPATETPVRMLFDHPHFHGDMLSLVKDELGLSDEPEFPSCKYWGDNSDDMTFALANLTKSLRNEFARLRPSPMLYAVRAALIVADAVGSALPRTNEFINDWVRERFDDRQLCDPGSINEIISGRRVVIESGGHTFKWNEFQNECEALPERALLLAPCGSGKTLAAWRWTLGQVKKRPVGRIIFLYPTKATATEGFKDYVSWAPESKASLLHGNAEFDLDGMFPIDDVRHRTNFDVTDPRLFALQHWSKRVFSATVDQFFAFLSYSYGPMCLLPLLVDSVIVIDEVHSFDRKMHSALRGFLKAFDVPVLCMTATILEGRKSQLQDLLGRTYEEKPGELQVISLKPRYTVKKFQKNFCQNVIKDAVAAGKRVLWVVNQVSRAQEAYAGLQDLDVPTICYHSRFRLKDRISRHRETVDTIRAGQPAAVVVSTQVCEMSLDIDADVLVTETCPIPSLIQRMGRCRRGRDELEAKGPGEVYIYDPGEERVYDQDDLYGITDFVKFLEVHSPVSQSDLEEGLERFGSHQIEASRVHPFLDSRGFADGKEDEFRDMEAFNVQSVLREDIEHYIAAPPKEKPGFILPVPRKLRPPQADRPLPPYLHVAENDHYDALSGYHDAAIR